MLKQGLKKRRNSWLRGSGSGWKLWALTIGTCKADECTVVRLNEESIVGLLPKAQCPLLHPLPHTDWKGPCPPSTPIWANWASWIHLGDFHWSDLWGCSYRHPLGLTASQWGFAEGNPVHLLINHTARQDWEPHSSTKPLGFPYRHWHLNLGKVHHIYHQHLHGQAQRQWGCF